ncbi:MAG: transcription-repair coupling factor [Alphaproteobacteria bacterium]
MISLEDLFGEPGTRLISSAPTGCDAFIIGRISRALAPVTVLHVARDDVRLARMADALQFFAPEAGRLTFPAWDCQPYDRISPRADIASRRLETLARLARPEANGDGSSRVVLTTINALLQRVPPRELIAGKLLTVSPGSTFSRERLIDYLLSNGYSSAGTVVEAGEYAVRGGLIDLFPPGASDPIRLDFFGETIESMRRFDAATQRSKESVDELRLFPVSELFTDPETRARFKTGYHELFGAVMGDDPLYESISAGRKYPGMEHWLPLFHERLETLFDYLPDALITLDHLVEDSRDARIATIVDHYEARLEAPEAAVGGTVPAYNPVPPERLYLTAREWDERMAGRAVAQFFPFARPPVEGERIFDAGGKQAGDFSAERAEAGGVLFDAVARAIENHRRQGKHVVIAAHSAGTLDRLRKLLSGHGLPDPPQVETWAEVAAMAEPSLALALLPLEHGFETAEFIVIGEQDILGDRLIRRPTRKRRSEDFLASASEISKGDLVVHMEHGIGRFDGLAILEVAGARHDCLRLLYDGGDRLFLPAENIEVLSRYGSEDQPVVLDKLGGASWQARTSRLKRRIRDMADELVRIAAERTLKPAPRLAPQDGLYEEFCARFPHTETEDQAQAIDETLSDLASGRPMDRLICGDVGFGKTEVALRAAFVTAMAGKQIAVVVPTTLLCRQHFETFRARFTGLPVNIAPLSRLVPAKRTAEVKAGLATGEIDIVIGTHALLSKQMIFHDLGLLVIDEEQHFGVTHKERLKQLKSNVHVLAMTATPIPRTLQLALSGVREMSVIATPPVDRLAVRTYILPFDAVAIRDALLREHYRSGQSFYVCPRISDIERLAQRVRRLVPEVKVATAHGRMPARALEDVMNAYYDGAYDVLVVTAIIESGLDIPAANTMIIHRADMFGLAQLYQLRGRIGRAKVRAYAYLTLEPERSITAAAEKRLGVLHKLDSLGAGFNLASYDLDIRGAGNLLGAEQSGHIREVGIELYQHLIEQAVAEARQEAGVATHVPRVAWTPQINIGASVLIPEDYVSDLGIRLGLYRRIARLEARDEIDAFAAELADRFGPVPDEVNHLLEIVAIKHLCREAGVEKIEAGPKGASLTFRDKVFAAPERLVGFIADPVNRMNLRPDSTLVARRTWGSAAERLEGASNLLGELVALARSDEAQDVGVA